MESAGVRRVAGIEARGGGRVRIDPVRNWQRPRSLGVALLAAPDGGLFVLASSDGHVVLAEPHGTQLEVVAQAMDARLSCYSPAPLVIHLGPHGDNVIGYCPFDDKVWWFDLSKMRLIA